MSPHYHTASAPSCLVPPPASCLVAFGTWRQRSILSSASLLPTHPAYVPTAPLAYTLICHAPAVLGRFAPSPACLRACMPSFLGQQSLRHSGIAALVPRAASLGLASLAALRAHRPRTLWLRHCPRPVDIEARSVASKLALPSASVFGTSCLEADVPTGRCASGTQRLPR